MADGPLPSERRQPGFVKGPKGHPDVRKPTVLTLKMYEWRKTQLAEVAAVFRGRSKDKSKPRDRTGGR